MPATIVSLLVDYRTELNGRHAELDGLDTVAKVGGISLQGNVQLIAYQQHALTDQIANIDAALAAIGSDYASAPDPSTQPTADCPGCGISLRRGEDHACPEAPEPRLRRWGGTDPPGDAADEPSDITDPAEVPA